MVTFNSTSLIPHAQPAIAQVLINNLKSNIYCVSETHLKSRNSVQFTGYNIIQNDNSTGATVLVRKDYHFEKVGMENLLAYSVAAT